MNEIVATNHLSSRIGENSERVASLPSEIAGDLSGVNADSYRSNAGFIELLEVLFDTPQLGVAGGSPISSVEDEQQTPWGLPVDWA